MAVSSAVHDEEPRDAELAKEVGRRFSPVHATPPIPFSDADMSFSLLDHTAQPAAEDIAGSCASALTQRVQRTTVLPELRVDPLSPLPLADAAGGVVRFVYFILASRPFGYETINRNVMVLQRPGALEDKGSNDTNLFLVHVDAKLGEVHAQRRDAAPVPRGLIKVQLERNNLTTPVTAGSDPQRPSGSRCPGHTRPLPSGSHAAA